MFRVRSSLFLKSFLLGIFSILTGIGLLQNIMASTGGKEFILAAIVAPVVLIGAFISIIPVLPHKQRDVYEPLYLFTAAMFSVFILLFLLVISILFTLELRKNLIQEASGELLLGIYLITTISSGAAFGILYGCFFCRAKLLAENRTHIFALLCGICSGGLLLFLLSFLQFSAMFVLKTTFSVSAIFLWVYLIVSLYKIPGSRWKSLLLFFGLSLLLGGFFTGLSIFSDRKIKPILDFSLDAPSGRYEFSQYGIFHNGKLRKKPDATPEMEKMRVLFPVLQQEENTALKAAVITSINTWLLYALRSMPNIESADVCLPDRTLFAIAPYLTAEKGKLHFYVREPMTFFREKERIYDLFIIGITDIYSLAMHRYHTEEMLETVKNSMKDDGIFMMMLPEPEGYSKEAVAGLQASIIATVERVFPNVLFSAGRVDILLASENRKLTLFPEELADRAEKLFGESSIIPSGLFRVTGNLLYDRSETDRILSLAREKSGNREFYPETVLLSWQNSPFLSSVLFQKLLSVYEFCIRHCLILFFMLTSLYLLLRYFHANSIDRRGLFLSFENGFYMMGTLALILYLFQIKTGSLYGNMPVLIQLFAFGGIAGALISKWNAISRIVYALAALLPFFVILPEKYPVSSMMYAAFSAGIYSGYAYFYFREICGNREYSSYIPSVTLLGCGCGFLIVTAFLIPSGGIFLCALILAATRIPRIVRG